MRQTPSRRDRTSVLGRSLLLGLMAATAAQLVPATGLARHPRVQTHARAADTDDVPKTVLIPARVLASMNERFVENNEHWDEAPTMNRITQLLRSGRPTQLEYMGCLTGEVSGDTVRVETWTEARNLIQLQFGVDGTCDHVTDLLGTWHTHPFRADVHGHPIKSRGLSDSDLRSFAQGDDRLILVLWDVDSVTVAVRNGEGEPIYPAPAVVR